MVDLPPQAGLVGQVIDEDLTCTRCGYNLRGLTRDGVCPECGVPVERSVHGNLLCYADPGWLDKLRLGTSLMLWNLLLTLLVGIAGAVAVFVGLPSSIIGLVGLIGGVLALWAMFLVTTPEPAAIGAEESVTVRKFVRTAAVISFVGQALQQDAQRWGLGVALVLVGGVLALLGLAAHVGFFVYFRRFAARVPDERLARSTTIVMWGYTIGLGLAAVFGLVAALAFGVFGGGGGAGIGGPIVAIGGCGVGIAALVFQIWYVSLLVRYRRAFAAARAQATQPVAEADASSHDEPQGESSGGDSPDK